MIGVALTIAASVAVGIGGERRWGPGAQRAAALVMTVLLWVVIPFIAFFTLARLEVTAGVGAGLALAYVSIALVMATAYVLGTRVLRLARPETGALMVASGLGNTGFVGFPLCVALLGGGALAPAVAFDTVVSGPTFLVAGFAIGAAFGLPGASRAQRVRSFFVRNPPLLAVVAGLLAPDALAPDALVEAAETVVYAVIPAGFFILGVTLSSERTPLRMSAPVAAVVGLKLAVLPLVFLGLTALVAGVPDAYRLQAAMPCAISSLIVAHAQQLDLRITAAAVAWSTGIVVAVALVADRL